MREIIDVTTMSKRPKYHIVVAAFSFVFACVLSFFYKGFNTCTRRFFSPAVGVVAAKNGHFSTNDVHPRHLGNDIPKVAYVERRRSCNVNAYALASETVPKNIVGSPRISTKPVCHASGNSAIATNSPYICHPHSMVVRRVQWSGYDLGAGHSTTVLTFGRVGVVVGVVEGVVGEGRVGVVVRVLPPLPEDTSNISHDISAWCSYVFF